MEILKRAERIVNSKPARSGLAIGAVLSMAHEVLTSPLEAAGPCKSLATRIVREFEDLGGVKDQYDSVIDKALGVIPGARVRYLINGQVFEVTTDNRGYSEIMMEAPCTSGNKMVATSEVITMDGRRVKDQIILQDGRKENFRSWVAVKRQIEAPAPYLTPYPTEPVVRGGQTNPFMEAVGRWWWVAPAFLLALGGAIGISRLRGRRLHQQQPQQP